MHVAAVRRRTAAPGAEVGIVLRVQRPLSLHLETTSKNCLFDPGGRRGGRGVVGTLVTQTEEGPFTALSLPIYLVRNES